MYIGYKEVIRAKIMVCPKCAYPKMRVNNTFEDGAITKRMRYCTKCHFMVKTEERPVFDNMMSIEEIAEYEKYINEETTEEQE